MRKWRLVTMLGTLSFPALVLQDPSLFQTSFAVTAGSLLLSSNTLYMMLLCPLQVELHSSFFVWWDCFWFSGGRTIIFTETKDSASKLAGLLPGAGALHGDIQQSQREVCCLCTYMVINLFFCFFVGLDGHPQTECVQYKLFDF